MIGTRALHLVARVAIRVAPPLSAKHIVDLAARLLPKYRSLVDAERDAMRIARAGTCLSRALTVAARLPGAEVVIGVAPPAHFAAHAWVETGGVRVFDGDATGSLLEVARLARAPHTKHGIRKVP